jgi:hypothetical protein
MTTETDDPSREGARARWAARAAAALGTAPKGRDRDAGRDGAEEAAGKGARPGCCSCSA